MTKTGVVLAVLFTLAVPTGLLAQSAQELYQRGLVQEHAIGDLKQAIGLYEQTARTAGSDRALAAKALIRMAASREKLGEDVDAASAYAELVRAYPEQHTEVAIAQGRMKALRQATRADAAADRGVSVGDISSLTRPMFDGFCANCHNAGNRAGGLDVQALSRGNVGENPALWEKVTRRLQARRDPPSGAPRPGDATYRSLVSRLEEALDTAYATNRTLLPVERVSDTELAARLATRRLGLRGLMTRPIVPSSLDSKRRSTLRTRPTGRFRSSACPTPSWPHASRRCSGMAFLMRRCPRPPVAEISTSPPS
jgi:tetratricopeptide (TPR) repeat protein